MAANDAWCHDCQKYRDVAVIMGNMIAEGVDQAVAVKALHRAEYYDNVRQLMQLWIYERHEEEKKLLIEDIKAVLEQIERELWHC